MKYSFHNMQSIDSFDYNLVKDKYIVIFGASHFGMIALYALERRGLNVIGFCDNNEHKQNHSFCMKPVFSITKLTQIHPNAHVFIAAKQYDVISEQLKQNGFISIYNCVSLFHGLEIEDTLPIDTNRAIRLIDVYMSAMLKQEMKNFSVNSLDVVVTEKCSLKCKNCSNLMQYYDNPQDCDLNILFSALQRFMDAIDYLHEFRVLGGEPFMVKKLDRILEYLQSLKKFGKILIYTNGTIIPSQEVLQGLKKDNIEVIVSDYGLLSKNQDKLITILGENNIKYGLSKMDRWTDSGAINFIKKTVEQLKHLYKNCCVIDVITLLNGKLYLCPFAAHAHNLQAVPAPDTDKIDYIDLLDESLDVRHIRELIEKMYTETEYSYACKYCNGRDFTTPFVPVAEQIENPIPYEVFPC